MKINEIPKFVINLKRREDRLIQIKKELEYIGWDAEIIEAVDTNDHQGITHSTLKILEIAEERGYERFMVMEDDCTFMPYAKSLLNQLQNEINDLSFGVFNFAPTLCRKVDRYKDSKLLLDLTNLPEKNPNDRDIYALNMIVYDKSIYETLKDIKVSNFFNGGFYHALDEYIFNRIISKFQSFSPVLPIAPQTAGLSNISNGYYNNFYTQTYNWNGYSPVKIPGEYLDYERNQINKELKIHNEINL